MKNFNKIEEQQLIKKIWNIHDEIFSLPAKRFIFAIIDNIIGGVVLFSYHTLKKINGKNVTIINDFKNINNINLEFGDKLIIIYCESNLDKNNDIMFKKDSINENLPKHDSIIIKTDFFNQSEFAMLYRECMLEYKYKKHINLPKIEGLYAFEYMIENLRR